jgi:hypothetical protein
MKVGQKVLIVEEKEDRSSEKEDNRVVQVLRVYIGHLDFGQNIPKRSVRQPIAHVVSVVSSH